MPNRVTAKEARVAIAVYLEQDLARELKNIALRERRSASMQAAVFIERGIRGKSAGS